MAIPPICGVRAQRKPQPWPRLECLSRDADAALTPFIDPARVPPPWRKTLGTDLTQVEKQLTAVAWGNLPRRIRALYVTSYQRTGGWLAEAFSSDSASEVVLEEVVGASEGVARLRDEVFDVVLVSHDPEQLDSLPLIEGLRAGGFEEPIIVLGVEGSEEMTALCYEVGADAYVPVNGTTTRTLIWLVARAMERHQLVRENRRLLEAERQRLRLEQDEARRMLEGQRALVCDLETTGPAGSIGLPHGGHPSAGENGDAPPPRRPALSLPAKLISHYRELLRAYVIMGSGNLAGEMSTLAELLAAAGFSARQTLDLHLSVLEELIQGLGSRSTRHVMTRADLLVLEVMVHLAECYRCRYRSLQNPPRQRMLPGFDSPARELTHHE